MEVLVLISKGFQDGFGSGLLVVYFYSWYWDVAVVEISLFLSQQFLFFGTQFRIVQLYTLALHL